MRTSEVRDTTFLDINVTCHPTYAPRHSMGYYIPKIEALYKAKQTDKWSPDRKRKLYIRDMKVTSKYAMLLLYYTNSNATGASYTDLDSNAQRDENLRKREGRPLSAHLYISLSASKVSPFRYLAVLEEAEGISRSEVENYIRTLIRKIIASNPKDFTEKHPDGSKKEYKFTNRLELEGHPSDDFKKLLNGGFLAGITLETDQIQNLGFGNGKLVAPESRKIKLRTTIGNWKDNPVGRFNEAIQLGKKHGYEKARIAFRVPSGKSQTAYVSTNSSSIIGQSFIKKVRLTNYSSLLRDADKTINTETEKKILAEI